MLNVDLAFTNANIITLNKRQPKAQAMAIQNNLIAIVGLNNEIIEHTTAGTRIIDLKNRTIVPGLVDCHVHMSGFGFSLQQVNLISANSIKKAQKTLEAFAEKNPEKTWILGGGWDQEKFAEKRYPNREDLDEAVKDRPVFLTRVCRHIAVANTKALQMAKITKDTNVNGGTVDKDEETGEPNGILREDAALNLIRKILPKPTEKELEQACLSACQKAVEAGLTCVHWMVTSRREIREIQKISTEDKLPLRVCLGISAEHAEELIHLGLMTGFGNDKVKIGFVKILADGSLGGRTAALKRHYSDQPQTRGMMLYTQKTLNKLVSEGHNAGLQIAIHAIGDRAVESALRAYEKAMEEHPRKDHRHRIEHCSVLNPELILKMKKLGLIASVQPHFVASDFWISERLGEERMRYVYPFKTMMKQDLTIVSGSDCPIENISPILGIWAAVARESNPKEGLTPQEALETYTTNAAYASFDKNKRGTIEAGKLADLTILSNDPLATTKSDIRKIKVEMTVVDGKIVYSALK